MKTYELTQLNQFTEDDTTAVVVSFVLPTMFISCMRYRQEPDCTLRDRIQTRQIAALRILLLAITKIKECVFVFENRSIQRRFLTTLVVLEAG